MVSTLLRALELGDIPPDSGDGKEQDRKEHNSTYGSSAAGPESRTHSSPLTGVSIDLVGKSKERDK